MIIVGFFAVFVFFVLVILICMAAEYFFLVGPENENSEINFTPDVSAFDGFDGVA